MSISSSDVRTWTKIIEWQFQIPHKIRFVSLWWDGGTSFSMIREQRTFNGGLSPRAFVARRTLKYTMHYNGDLSNREGRHLAPLDSYILKHARIQRGGGARGPYPPEKSQKYRVSKQYWSGSPEKSQSYQARIQCWVIIGPPANRHLNGYSLAGQW